MGNIESVDGQSDNMKHHIMPLKVPIPDQSELEERFALVLVSDCCLRYMFELEWLLGLVSCVPDCHSGAISNFKSAQLTYKNTRLPTDLSC
jgi:hypothetical protein